MVAVWALGFLLIPLATLSSKKAPPIMAESLLLKQRWLADCVQLVGKPEVGHKRACGR